jgi:hypothetical protein
MSGRGEEPHASVTECIFFPCFSFVVYFAGVGFLNWLLFLNFFKLALTTSAYVRIRQISRHTFVVYALVTKVWRKIRVLKL